MNNSAYPKEYDIIVIGAGHAGCEAALAGARMGFTTLVLTIDLDHVAFMPCNPSIGGPAKGHIVREIDALGGEMGRAIDATMIQMRRLNTRKGPAVRALRAQADKKEYHLRMKRVLEEEERLDLKQGLVASLVVENGLVRGVVTETGILYRGRKVILTSGTFLRSRIIIGEATFEAGPNQQYAAQHLSENLVELGFALQRFKTGTPPRILERSLELHKTVEQKGDEEPACFSFSGDTDCGDPQRVACFLTYTNKSTHEIIQNNIHRAPLFSGTIEGRGPRYCPSIEDKVVRFPQKDRHQIFIEPEGLFTGEMYLSGLPTSLPEDVQFAFLRTIEGMQKVEMMRPGYAIEYDVIDPTQLTLTLETKSIKGLYTAGQVNGTSGYEEAAGQGIVAGINAALRLMNRDPFILPRSQAYIGVLIDDLITKGTEEPYRMLTSRAEYRLLLRHDNADQRLTKIGRDIGLVRDTAWKKFCKKKEEIDTTLQLLEDVQIRPTNQIQEYLQELGSGGLQKPVPLKEIFRRPEIQYEHLKNLWDGIPEISKEAQEELSVMVKYEGYIQRQERDIAQFKKLENKLIPADLSFDVVPNLSSEGREKLKRISPRSLGQAQRISGVSAADITVLLLYLEQRERK